MFPLLFLLLSSSAMAEEVDLAPSGAVVTIRPEDDEYAAVVNRETGEILSLPADAPDPMWLVHPAAWRSAVAQATGQQILEPLPDEQAAIIKHLETDLAAAELTKSGLTLRLQSCESTYETETKMLRRSRTHWLIAGAGAGLLIGASGVAFITL